jgi:hypothetical protein
LNTQLHAALKARDDVVENLKPIDQRIAKIERLLQTASPAVAEKSALHSDHTVRLKDWVASGDVDAPPPAIAADRLARLDAEISAHESSKASASEGLRALVAARSKLVDEHRTAIAAAQFAASEHAITEALPKMIDDFNSAHRVLVEAKDRIDNAYRFLMAEGARLANTQYNGLAERMWSEVKAKTVTPVSREDYTPFRDRIAALLAPANVEAI